MAGVKLTGTAPAPQLVAAGQLLQHVSIVSYRASPLYFGRSGANRYDDPKKVYGVFYCAVTLETALMESVFHRHNWGTAAARSVTYAEVKRRIVRVATVTTDLRLLDLTAPGVMTQLGLNLSQLASSRYRTTQSISGLAHSNTDASGALMYDGLLYPSRNNYPQACMALFDRAAPSLGPTIQDIDLAMHIDWPGFVSKHQIAIIP